MAEKTTKRPSIKFMVRSVAKSPAALSDPNVITAEQLDNELQELGVPEFYDLKHFEYTGDEVSKNNTTSDTMRYSILLVKKAA